VKQGHVVVVQDGGVKIPLPETKAILQGMAQPVGEFVHPGVGKASAPFDINHGGMVGKPQSSLLKYPAHVYDHRIRLLNYQIRGYSPYKIPNYKHQLKNKSQIPIFNDQDKFGISNLGHCYLFDICDLDFGIYKHPSAE
jgi:hypothetical protein